MSAPFGETKTNKPLLSFEGMLASLKTEAKKFPDNRTGKNLSYSAIEDIALSAFSAFYLQHPSFLDQQQQMEVEQGENNARNLFGIDKIPTANHIRTSLDGGAPSILNPVYEGIVTELYQQGMLEDMRCFNEQLLVAFDGVHFHESQKISCDCCSHKTNKKDEIHYFHSAVTPVIVSPKHKRAVGLPPEFITPQDGHQKQDSELAAAKRWLSQHGSRYRDWGVTILGDDLYCHQPFCEEVLAQGYHFLLVCKPDSHKTLYEWLDGLEKTGLTGTKVQERRIGKRREIDTYRFVSDLPLRNSDDALKVNWCELTTTTPEGEVLYRNAFATDHKIDEHKVAEVVAAGRSRWKIENENNNTLKTKGYHLEHNFGHGKKGLANLLASMNMLAFLFHTVLEMTCEAYVKIRKKLGARNKFFDHIRTLTHYICFENWTELLRFMATRLKVKVEALDTG